MLCLKKIQYTALWKPFLNDIFCYRAGLLCLDGKTKCFDRNGDGYVRADAINVIFLQKAQDAHRYVT